MSVVEGVGIIRLIIRLGLIAMVVYGFNLFVKLANRGIKDFRSI
ncbi:MULTISPECIES: hypothetical protein [Clostridium]|nr:MULTISPECIES: hypothetical protein [Clostridium]